MVAYRRSGSKSFLSESAAARGERFMTDRHAFQITADEFNQGPEITSDGGGDTAAPNVAENATAVTTVVGFDPDYDTLAYSIASGDDAALFAIDSSTGALTFVSAPDFEAPADTGSDNVYEVVVRASDGTDWDDQALSVAVGDLNDSVWITSQGGGATGTIMFYENGLGTLTYVQASKNAGSSIVYSIAGGADAALFQINATTGRFEFVWGASPEYEAPADADGNNLYQVTVAASNGLDIDTQALTVNVINVNEAPVFTSFGGTASAAVSVTENTILAAAFSAVDPEGLTMLTYTIVGGADAAQFTVNPWNGALVFRSAPNFEVPADAGLNNVYDVVVRATDQANPVTQALAVTVTNVVTESVVTGTASSNTLTGGAGDDIIYGLGGIDTISGLGGNDVLDGGASNDTLVGGAGADHLLGGLNGDTYRYDAASDSPVGGHDVLFDFNRTQSDRISLTGVDANSLVGGDQNFTFIGTNAFGSIAGELRYEKVGGNTFIYGDLDGNAVTDFMLQLNGEHNLFAADLFL